MDTTLNHKNINQNFQAPHLANNFDFIRLFAAALVILWHSATLTGHNSIDPIFSLSSGTINSGNLGVATFFITSGFLISGSLLRDPNILKFSYNRLLRIIPGLFLSVMVCILVVGPLATNLTFSSYFFNSQTWHFLKNISIYSIQWLLPGCFLDNLCTNAVNGSLWTIPHEVTCYIIVGIFGFLGFLRFQGFILFLFLALIGIHHAELNGFSWIFPSRIFGNLLFPDFIELALLFTSGILLNNVCSKMETRIDLLFICMTFLLISICTGCGREALPLFMPYIIYHVAFSKSLNLTRFGRYGDFSYGTYLYAFPVQQLLAQKGFITNKVPLLHLLLSLILSVICGAVSWYCIESYFMKLKSRKNNLAIDYFCELNKFIQNFTSIFLIGKFKILFLSILFLCSGVYICYLVKISSPLTIIRFSQHPKIHATGTWLEQSKDEPYRWIDRSGTVSLKQHAGISHLHFCAYVPKQFKNVIHVKLMINEIVIYEKDRSTTSGDAWAIDVFVPLETSQDRDSNLSIIFNDENIPEKSEPDQRRLSAAISEISIE
jgi:peptidoglycan/LPS O-acetylase OafA/YrhL